MIYLLAGLYAIIAGNAASYALFIFEDAASPEWASSPAAFLMQGVE